MNTPIKDSTSIIYLRKIYKERFKRKDEISEKDIVYFLRDSISDVYYPIKFYDKKRLAKSFYETEILNLVKAKEWDWHYVDIDNCNILTYSIFNKADSIADYLIKNKYDLTIYEEDVSHALKSSIRMNNIEYFKKIVHFENINEQYLIDLNVHSYIMKSANPAGLGAYNDHINTLNRIHEPHMIYKTVEDIVKSHCDFDKFLEHHQFDPKNFIEITEKILNDELKNIYKTKASQLITSFSNYKLYHDLNKNLENKTSKPSKKI